MYHFGFLSLYFVLCIFFPNAYSAYSLCFSFPLVKCCVCHVAGLSVRENVTLTDPETNGSTNSSSVAVAILVPFFALIFAGLGFYLYKQRKTDKAQYTGCSVHENNNGQATFENPMYNTNTKAAEGKVVRFDPNLNTICTMV